MIVGLLLKLYHNVTDRPTDGQDHSCITVRLAELTCGKNASLQQTQSLISHLTMYRTALWDINWFALVTPPIYSNDYEQSHPRHEHWSDPVIGRVGSGRVKEFGPMSISVR